MKLMHIINYAINLIFPNVCGICEKICKENLCKKCEINLNNIAKVKIDIYNNKNFKKHLYLFKYEKVIKNILINFKFNEKTYIYKAFTSFIIKNKKVCSFLLNYDIIIPIPIHNKRKLERGYNQSALIAKDISKNIKQLQYNDNELIKIVNNKPQSTKNKFDRQKNVIGVYKIKNETKIKNKKILLFDDIYTTGSTVNECAKLMKNAGAKCVDVITIAKD